MLKTDTYEVRLRRFVPGDVHSMNVAILEFEFCDKNEYLWAALLALASVMESRQEGINRIVFLNREKHQQVGFVLVTETTLAKVPQENDEIFLLPPFFYRLAQSLMRDGAGNDTEGVCACALNFYVMLMRRRKAGFDLVARTPSGDSVSLFTYPS